MKKLRNELTEEILETKIKIVKEVMNVPEFKVTLSDSGTYLDAKQQTISNFFIVCNASYLLYDEFGKQQDIIHSLELVFPSLKFSYTLEIESAKALNYKWIKESEISFMLEKPSQNYLSILKYINHVSETFHPDYSGKRFKTIGFQYINNEWVYSTSNACISNNGISYNNHSIIEGFNLNSSFSSFEACFDSEHFKMFSQKTFIDWLELLNKNIGIILPVFLANITSILSSTLSDKGILLPVSIWISGAPGSGKSLLSLLVGTFLNRSQHRSDSTLTQNNVRANTRTKHLLKQLTTHRDVAFVLDDIKIENSTKLKESLLNNIDTVIRSVFDKKYESAPVLCTAIINGEYIPTGQSTISRLLHCNINNFINDKVNSDIITELQNNGFIIPDFMVIFINWLCKNLADEGFIQNLEYKKKAIKKENEDLFTGTSKSRYLDVLITFQLAFDILISSCKDLYVNELVSFDFTDFCKHGKRILLNLVKDTRQLTTTYDNIYAECITDLIVNKTLLINKSKKEYVKNTLNYFHFCVLENEAGIFIPDALDLADIYTQNYSAPFDCLIIQKKALFLALQYELCQRIKSKRISPYVLNELSIKRLTECQILLVDPRYDHCNNNQFNYPKYNIQEQKATTDSYYRINIHHPSFKRLRDYLLTLEERSNNFSFSLSTDEYDFIGDYPNYFTLEDKNDSQYRQACNFSKLNDVYNKFGNIFEYYYEKQTD